MKTPNETNMNAENAFLLREAAKAHSDGYSDHLAHGGKGDPAEERWIEALFAGADALAFIQQLEAANTELLTKVKQLEAKCHQLERERDAAVAALKSNCVCYECEWLDDDLLEGHCNDCNYENSSFKWRGVKEE